LLANARFEVISEEAFLQEVGKRGLDEREFHNKFLYLRVWEYVQERMSLTLGLRHNLTENTHILHQVTVMDDFFVREPRFPWLDQVNRVLKKLRLPCLISSMICNELKQKLKLGGIFPIYRLRDGWGQEYSVAFGQEALLLDSLLFFLKPNEDRPMIL
jgi:CRISPR-associated endonuclease/helicase Cas3